VVGLVLILSTLVLIGIAQGRNWEFIVFFAVAQLVSAVPEGLPIVITIALVIGAIRLARNNVLVRYLPAVETLGSATFICTDKTGTITEGRLRVEDYIPFERGRAIFMLRLVQRFGRQKGRCGRPCPS
jgi:Ca2+-transporting ATPase